MVRRSIITALSGIILILYGCGKQSRSKPVYEQVKIYELAPSPSVTSQPQMRGLIELDTYIFELPTTNFPLLEDLWNTKLSDSMLRYRSAEAFKASGFVAGVGTMETWNEIGQILRSAESRKTRTVSLLLSENQSDYVPVASIESERTVFYARADGKIAGLSVSKGMAAFHVKAQGIPATRGAFRLSLQPVFRKPLASRIKQLAGKKNYEDTTFDSIGFEMQMSPGQFVLVGPGEYGTEQMSLSGLFFRHSKPRPLVRIYLILCRNINK